MSPQVCKAISLAVADVQRLCAKPLVWYSDHGFRNKKLTCRKQPAACAVTGFIPGFIPSSGRIVIVFRFLHVDLVIQGPPAFCDPSFINGSVLYLQARLSQCMCFVVQASLGISRATSVDACALERSQASLASRTKLTSLHPRAHLVLARPFQVCEDSCSTSFPRSRARLNRHACKLPRTNKRPLSLLRLLPRFTKAACVEKASVVVCWILYGRKFAGQHLGVTGASLVLLAAPGVAADLPKAYIAPATSVAGSTSVQNTTCSQLDLADASFSDQNDPVNPFTLFGNTRKKFLIEILEGTKVISRKKGFTTTTCVSGVAIGQQTKQFDNLPESAKTDAADNQLCSKRTGPDLQLTCNASCAKACTAALNEYADRDSRLTGYSIDGKTKDKLSKSCTKQCTYECAKPGDKYGFAIPYRARE